MSDNYCSQLGLWQPVPEANSPKNLPSWKLPPKTRLTGRQTWPPTSDCHFRSAYPMLRWKPQPGPWLIQRGSLTSWRVRFMVSPQMNRTGWRRNFQSTWLSLNLGGRQSAFRRSGKPLNSTWSILDIQRCIMWAIYRSQFGESVPVTILPLIFLNGYISPKWKRHIDLGTKSITFDRCSSTMTRVPVLTIWRKHCHILHSKADTILTLQKLSTYCLLPINGEVHAEPIFYVCKQFRIRPLSALDHSKYIIWEKHMSGECAEVSN